jgi:hypothetical protein
MSVTGMTLKPGITIRPAVTVSAIQIGNIADSGLSSGSYHFKIDVTGVITKNDFWFGTPPTLNTASMTPVMNADYDDNSFEVPALSNGGFPVNFLGTTYSSFWVSGNGAVSFGAENNLRDNDPTSAATESYVNNPNSGYLYPCLYMNNNDSNLREIWYTVLGGNTLAYKIRGNTDYTNDPVINYDYDIYFYPMGLIDVIVNQEPTHWSAYHNGVGQVKWGITNGSTWIDGLSNHGNSIGYTP